MNKMIVLAITAICIIESITAQTAPKVVAIVLRGKITDAKTGMPLPGASVYFADARIGTIAGANGKYLINNVPHGHHLLEVSHTGYNSIVEHIDMHADIERNFSLNQAITENIGVTVTGVSNATSIRKAPVPVLTIRKAELLQLSSTNIIDAISKKPGVSQVTTGPGISKPVIRGLGYNRVVVVNEGVRQEGQQWGDEHGIEVDEMSVSRVEILKGPASLMYGSDALAGVINLITNIPQQEGTIKGNVFSSYQTNNQQAALNANIAGNLNGINWNIYGSTKSARDYWNKYDGYVLNSRFNEKNFGGYIGVNKGWGFSHLIFSAFNQNPGLVEGDRDPATGKFLVYAGTALERIASASDLKQREPLVPSQNVRHYKLATDNSFTIGHSRVKLNLGYQQNLRKEFSNPEDPGETELYFDLETFNYSLQWVLPEVMHWNTTIGVNGMQQSNGNRGEERIIPDYSIFDVGAFVNTQRGFNKLMLSGGLRLDNRQIDSKEYIDGTELKFVAFEKSFSNFSGSIGFSYEPAEFLTIKANLARGYRAPNLAELASNGAHEGTDRFEYGNMSLSSEKSLQFDAGTDVDYEHFSFTFDVFYNRVQDFIYYRKLEAAGGGDSIVIADREALQAFRFDQDDAVLSGLEAGFDFHPHPLDWLHFENTISFVRGRFDSKVDGTGNLPLMPPTRWISELRGNFIKTGKTFSNLYLKLEADRTFAQSKPFFAYDTETATPGYTLLNAAIGSDVVAKGKILFSFHIVGTNLNNKGYQSHLSRLKYTDMNQQSGRSGVFNMGRNFSIKVNVPLSFK